MIQVELVQDRSRANMKVQLQIFNFIPMHIYQKNVFAKGHFIKRLQKYRPSEKIDKTREEI